jgi:ABC-type glycerol-3-phosphate transport system substrate-binding protein
LATALVAALLIAGWQIGQRQLAQLETRLRQGVQVVLDLEHKAVLAGDGELFFTVQAPDPAWFSAQLLPENQAANRAGLQATRVEQHEDYLWANVTWSEGDETWQRIAFFLWQDGRFVHVPSAPGYWGQRRPSAHEWGELIVHQVDSAWSDTIAAFVAGVVAESCTAGCLEGQRPFALVITSDFSQTAAPGRIHVPSPRLLALTEAGEPGALFWNQLRRQIEAHLMPVTIRFAVPPDEYQLLDYKRAAADFMLAYPRIRVELVHLEALPDDPLAALAGFDGAAVTPTAEMVTAGLVYDLTDFVQTDPNFDQADFYEQIWQGAHWQERMWLMPQGAAIPLIFYDKTAYRHAGLPEPSLRWTWDEMASDVSILVAAQPEESYLKWGFLDAGRDALFAYAYNWNNTCGETVTIRCRRHLRPQNVAAALEWYSQMVARAGGMPDLASLSPFERANLMVNYQSARRQAAIWVDEPVSYEHYLLLAPIGVVPFPGSDRFDGITPLWLRGNFISGQSQRPLAVWQWIKYLSYLPPAPRWRLVPARPSDAIRTRYWINLPRPLGDVMRTAFPFTQPVSLREQNYFSWSQLAAVTAGKITVQAAAQQPPNITWFGANPK